MAFAVNADTFLGSTRCEDVIFLNGMTEQICFHTEREPSNPSFRQDGALPTQDNGLDFHYIYEGQYDGLRFHVSWDDDRDDACRSIIGIQECSSCRRCNRGVPSSVNSAVQVDCRNVPQGTATGCQTLAPDSLIFPLDPYRTSDLGEETETSGRFSSAGSLPEGEEVTRGKSQDEQRANDERTGSKCGRLGCRGRGPN